MTLVPFNNELNRFLLVVRNAPAGRYRVTWGETSRTYTSEELARGINLAADFETNPFSEAFKRVDEAIAKKQAYETRQVKDLFHGPEGKADLDMTAALTEKARTPLADAIHAAFVPVRHTIGIAAEPQTPIPIGRCVAGWHGQTCLSVGLSTDPDRHRDTDKRVCRCHPRS